MTVGRWADERRRDHWYQKAKREGYRSRAAYKLKQMIDEFYIVKTGDHVVDLGAAPGGWTQVAVENVGEEGRVVGVDLQSIRPVEGASFLVGDMTEAATVERVLEALGEGSDDGSADVVISDMSPDITGTYSVDHARSVHLSRLALDFARRVLRRQGRFVVKVFQGPDLQDLEDEARKHFNLVKRHVPEASRSASSEIYLVAKGFKGEDHRPEEPLGGDGDGGDEDPSWSEGVPPPSRRGNR